LNPSGDHPKSTAMQQQRAEAGDCNESCFIAVRPQDWLL
jgi:hypothetical protein